MLKRDELAIPTSCLNKAADDEPVFVLRAKDVCAAIIVECWAHCASGIHEPERVAEALALAQAMRDWRKVNVQ